MSRLYFCSKQLKIFCVQSQNHNAKKNYKIAIVKICPYIVQNCNQSHTNFQFFKASSSMFGYCNPTGGRKPPAGPAGPQGAQRAPSPPQELEGWARSAQIFQYFILQSSTYTYKMCTLCYIKVPCSLYDQVTNCTAGNDIEVSASHTHCCNSTFVGVWLVHSVLLLCTIDSAQ